MFAKIFVQIYDSSIVENPELRFTFMDLLVLADSSGVVDMTHEAIARRTNRPIELIRQTIAELEGPDPTSRTPTDEGRRLKRLDTHRDWGWIIVNYDHFRAIASDMQRREKTAARVRKYREKVRGNDPVTLGNARQRKKRHAEADAEGEGKGDTEAPPKEKTTKRFVVPTLADVRSYCHERKNTIDPQQFVDYYTANGWRVGRNGMKDWKAAVRTWERNSFGSSNGKPTQREPTPEERAAEVIRKRQERAEAERRRMAGEE